MSEEEKQNVSKKNATIFFSPNSSSSSSSMLGPVGSTKPVAWFSSVKKCTGLNQSLVHSQTLPTMLYNPQSSIGRHNTTGPVSKAEKVDNQQMHWNSYSVRIMDLPHFHFMNLSSGRVAFRGLGVSLSDFQLKGRFEDRKHPLEQFWCNHLQPYSMLEIYLAKYSSCQNFEHKKSQPWTARNITWRTHHGCAMVTCWLREFTEFLKSQPWSIQTGIPSNIRYDLIDYEYAVIISWQKCLFLGKMRPESASIFALIAIPWTTGDGWKVLRYGFQTLKPGHMVSPQG